MVRKRYKSRERDTEKSFADYVSSANKKLVTLAKSEKATDKFCVLNAVVFIFVLSFIITHFIIYPESLWSLSGLLILFISLIISLLVGAYGYVNLLDVLVQASQTHKQQDEEVRLLKIGVIILLFAYPLALSGLLFGIRLLIYLTFGIIAIQPIVLIIYPLLGISVPRESKVQYRGGLFKDTTGMISLIIGIVDIIVTVASIVVSLTQIG